MQNSKLIKSSFILLFLFSSLVFSQVTYQPVIHSKATPQTRPGDTYSGGVILKGTWVYDAFSYENHGAFRKAGFRWGYTSGSLPNLIVVTEDNSTDFNDYVWLHVWHDYEVNFPLLSNATIYYAAWVEYEHKDNGLQSVHQQQYSVQYIDTTPPSQPLNLSVTIVNGHPYLTWAANTEHDLEGYYIYRNENGWEKIGSVSQTSYTDYQVDVNPMFLDVIEYKVTAHDYEDNESNYSNTVSVENAVLHKNNKEDELNIVNDFHLYNNYPNPFNPTTVITYNIPQSNFVTLKVYDILGKEVASLVNETKQSGLYSVEFNAANIPSGVYFYKITAGSFVEIKKMNLLK